MTMRSRVNQKLYYTRLLLERAQGESGAAAAALLEGAVFHLVAAYRCYLREIAASYRRDTDADSAAEALAALASQGCAAPELEELARAERGGWAQQLLAAHRRTSHPAATVTPSSPRMTIAATDLTDTVDTARCEQWLQSLQALLASQRERLQEC